MWVVALGALAFGTGIVEDVSKIMVLEWRSVEEEEYVLAARARDQSTAPLIVRNVSTAAITAALGKLPAFVGVSIPFEVLFGIAGIGVLSKELLGRWLMTEQGTPYPLLLLVVALAIANTIALLVADTLRLVLDPRQRDDLHG